MQHSESLLTEILLLLQNLNSNVHQFESKLNDIEKDIGDYKAHIDSIIAKAFPDGLVATHAEEHIKLARVNWFKRFLRWLDRDVL